MHDRTTRRAFLALAAATSLSGCTVGTGGGGSRTTTPELTPSATPTPTERPRSTSTVTPAETLPDGGPPVAETPRDLAYSRATLRSNVVSGGPPKDGIPAIDDPSFIEASAADERIDDGDVVFGVVRGDTVRAYRQSILVWHEIVNDEVDGVPVSVTYCPLTGTAMGFERGETTFGVSGNLVNNNLVMYDRATDSRWPQVLATAIDGPYEGHSLREFRVVWTTWKRWRERHPETEVLSENTGYARNYDADPYGSYNPRKGYYAAESTMFATLSDDDRLSAKTVVLGARIRDGAVAFEKSSLREAKLRPAEVGGTPYLAVYDPTLDTGYVYRNPDGTSYTYEDGAVAGPDGTAHEPGALPLERALPFDAMWFAWVGFYPETVLHA